MEHLVEGPRQQLAGIGPVAVNIDSGVAAAQSSNTKRHQLIAVRQGSETHIATHHHIPAAGATDREHPFGLRIQVDHEPAAEEIPFKRFSPRQSGFLIHGK